MVFKNVVKIPIKYKFLAVLLLVTFASIGVFFNFAERIFNQDKRLFVMDLNLSLLRAATSEIKLEIQSRVESMQILIPRLYRVADLDQTKIFDGLPDQLPKELLRVRFLKDLSDGKFDLIREYKNSPLIDSKHLGPEVMAKIDERHPLKIAGFLDKRNIDLLNRSIRLTHGDINADVGVLTILLPGLFADTESKDLIIEVDLLQDFIRDKLNSSEYAQIYLITKQGTLLSHGSLEATVDFSSNPYLPPIVDRIQKRQFPRESFELELEGDQYLCNVSESGFPDIFAVSQIRRADAFRALSLLQEKSVLIGAFILCISIILSILFASRMSRNIQKLRLAAEQIGAGNLRIKLKIHSYDEVESVANSFNWMVTRLKGLIEEASQKTHLEDELETARLVKATVLSTTPTDSNRFQIASHYSSATEFGGDLWDTRLDGNILTAYIGDATGHGSAAAIITAAAKSCFNTISTIYEGQPLSPPQILSTLNYVLYEECHGKLLMTMCVAQLNLDTGELLVASAGHAAPLCLRHKRVSSHGKGADKDNKDFMTETLFARGERLGFDPTAVYEAAQYKMHDGDVLLMYSDGLSEAKNTEGKDFGERSIKKVLTRHATKPIELMKDQMVTAFDEFTVNVPPTDDITFILVSLAGDGTQNAGTAPISGDPYAEAEGSVSDPAAAAGDQKDSEELSDAYGSRDEAETTSIPEPEPVAVVPEVLEAQSEPEGVAIAESAEDAKTDSIVEIQVEAKTETPAVVQTAIASVTQSTEENSSEFVEINEGTHAGAGDSTAAQPEKDDFVGHALDPKKDDNEGSGGQSEAA